MKPIKARRCFGTHEKVLILDFINTEVVREYGPPIQEVKAVIVNQSGTINIVSTHEVIVEVPDGYDLG